MHPRNYKLVRKFNKHIIIYLFLTNYNDITINTCKVDMQVTVSHTKRISDEVQSTWWIFAGWRVLALNPKQKHTKVCPKNSLSSFVVCFGCGGVG